jgi:hypothetical protein
LPGSVPSLGNDHVINQVRKEGEEYRRKKKI